MRILFFMGPMLAQSQTAHSLYLARKLIEMGHEVQVVAGPGPYREAFARWKVPVTTIPFWSIPVLETAGLHQAAAATQWRPDLVHVQSHTMARRGARFAAALGVPYFLTNHALVGKREKLFINPRWVRGVVAGSQEIREQLVNRHKVSRTLVKVITAGVDTGYFRADNGGVRTGDRIPVVGMVGRFERHKGGDLFIKAASMVLDRGRDSHFLMAGDGPENEAWRQLVFDHALHNRITFASSSRDFRMLMNAIDIFVRPSLREGTGMSLLEAMASGKPVIATGVGGVYNVVEENQTGFLVPRGDVARLAVSIMKLIDDPELAARMGRQGRAVVEKRFDIADKVVELVRFYEERLEEGPQ